MSKAMAHRMVNVNCKNCLSTQDVLRQSTICFNFQDRFVNGSLMEKIRRISREQKLESDRILRNLLKIEFEKRVHKNPAFSLRAFAKKINIQQDLLSKLLNGKRGFSPSLTQKVSNFLGLVTQQIFSEMPLASELSNYSFVEDDEFMTISHWSNFAVIEVLKLKHSIHSSDYIAEKLGLPRVQTESILERLDRLGYIKKSKSRYKILKPSTHWLSQDKTSAARKNYQKELLYSAISSIEDIDLSLRDNSSTLFALDSKLIPEIKYRITQFRRNLDKYIIENSKHYDQVYNLSVALFPLSQTSNRAKN
jgi:hypothetical protein